MEIHRHGEDGSDERMGTGARNADATVSGQGAIQLQKKQAVHGEQHEALQEQVDKMDKPLGDLADKDGRYTRRYAG